MSEIKLDIPNLLVVVDKGDQYNVKLTPALTVTSQTAGTFFKYADYANLAGLATLATTASYALASAGTITDAINAQTASTVLGGTQYYLPLWSSATTLTSSLIYQTGSSILIGSTTQHTPEAPDALGIYAGVTDSYNLLSAHGSIDNYLQLNVKNFSTGITASADIVAYNDSDVFLDMGVNSSTYDFGGIGGPNDAYFFASSVASGEGDLLIGNTSPNKRIILFTGGGDADANARVYINPVGVVGINTTQYNAVQPEALTVRALTNTYNLIKASSNINNYSQIVMQNEAPGTNASSDIVAAADNSTETVNYIDMGVNSSAFNTGYVGDANDAYLYSTAKHLHIGNVSNEYVAFFAGGSDVDVHNKFVISPNNQHSMTGSLTLTGTLTTLAGTINNITASYAMTASYVSGAASTWDTIANKPSGLVSSSSQINTGSFSGSFTGTLTGTGSWAVSASRATTASFATTASYVDYTNVANKPTLISSSTQINTGSFSGSFTGTFIGTASVASTAVSASYVSISGLPVGTVSSSTQVSYTSISNVPANIVSSSAQVTALLPTGAVSSSAQINTGSFTGSFIGTHSGSTFGTASWASNVISASYISPSGLPSGVVSSSSQVSYTGLSNIPTGIVSSSTQASTWTVATSSIATSASYALTASYVAGAVADWNTLANKPAGLVSSSTQINTGSFSGSFTGNFIGTSSWASNVISSSFATTASAATSITFTPASASFATTASYALNASGGTGTGFPFSGSAIITGSLLVSQSGVNVTGSVNVLGNISSTAIIATTITASNGISTSISASNITNGIPTSNAWQTSLNGSYFNNFTSNTNVSEILRFVAGLLSASAPDAAPNTKTFSTVTANQVNATTGTVTVGNVPQASTNATINYLNSRGFATVGSAIFAGISPIYTATNYGYTYTSVAAGTTTVSSSVDAQLFGLGQLSSGTPTNFNVSGSFTFKFKDNSTKTDTATSSSGQIITQTGAGTTNGVTLAKINTVNSAVIPAAYQDGKFAAAFAPSLYTGSATTVSSSGYVHISASISIASGSGLYNTPITSSNEIFWAPLATISANIPAQTPTVTGSMAVLTATSRSLSGAPYLSGSTYSLSGSVSGAFNPLYFVGNITTTANSGIGLSGTTTVTTNAAGVATANAVYDSTGVTARATSTVPFETDVIKVNQLVTFAASTNTNIAQSSITPTTFTITTSGLNKAGTATTSVQTVNYHTAGTFGQPVSSGSMAYWGRNQGTDTSPSGSSTTVTEAFLGENNRIQLTDSVLSFTGTAWNTGSVFYNLGSKDLQVKPGYLVTPGGTNGYWITNPSSASTYKYYIRRFQVSPASTKTTMTLNLGVTLLDWESTSAGVAALILFESSNSTTPNVTAGRARFYDPTQTTAQSAFTVAANTDGTNPFGASIDIYDNSNGGSVASNVYTVGIYNPAGMILNSTYDEIYVLVRYNGDPTPITSMTVTW